MAVTINASTTSGLIQSADTSGTIQMQSNGTTKLTVSSSGVNIGQMNGGVITSGTAVASTSGTAIDFTNIPSWVKRITVMFQGVSTDGTSDYWLRLGTSGGFATSGYVGYMARQAASSNSYNAFSQSFVLTNGFLATEVFSGNIVITNQTGNVWTMNGQITGSNSTGNMMNMAGYVSLSGTLTQVRITSATPNNFDAGTINILYEG
jgi:hypothetical protein